MTIHEAAWATPALLGSYLGIFMVDCHPRPGKRGGAWAGGYRRQHFRAGQDIRPIGVNVCNFTRPAGSTPALLSLEEVETLFHEFGRGLHTLLSRPHYRSLGSVPRDFVEPPSRIMEHWAPGRFVWTPPTSFAIVRRNYHPGAAQGALP